MVGQCPTILCHTVSRGSMCRLPCGTGGVVMPLLVADRDEVLLAGVQDLADPGGGPSRFPVR